MSETVTKRPTHVLVRRSDSGEPEWLTLEDFAKLFTFSDELILNYRGDIIGSSREIRVRE